MHDPKDPTKRDIDEVLAANDNDLPTEDIELEELDMVRASFDDDDRFDFADDDYGDPDDMFK